MTSINALVVNFHSETYLIEFVFDVEGIFSNQQSRRYHDASKNEVPEVTMVAQPVTKYPKPTAYYS